MCIEYIAVKYNDRMRAQVLEREQDAQASLSRPERESKPERVDVRSFCRMDLEFEVLQPPRFQLPDPVGG